MKSILGVTLSQSVLSSVFRLVLLGCLAPLAYAQDPVDCVDPTIGNVPPLLEPTRPTVSLPNSMVRVLSRAQRRSR